MDARTASPLTHVPPHGVTAGPIATIAHALPWLAASETQATLWTAVLAELRAIEATPNPMVPLGLRHVHVLSGRSSYLNQPVDSPTVLDCTDDFNRMNLGISIAREAASLACGVPASSLSLGECRRFGPVIIYNGRPAHNRDLRAALNAGLIRDYPPEQFKILELPPDQLNTRGHFLSLEREYPIREGSVGIVTHGYHCSRVMRMVGAAAPIRSMATDVPITFFLVDRTFVAPGAEQDIVGEFDRIPRYVGSGDLTEKPDPKITYQ